MSEQIDEQAIVTKIEALFRQANHPNTGQAERAAFQAKAMALMTKYRIETVNLEDANEKPDTHLFDTIKGTYARHLHQIIMAVCACYGCKTYYIRSGKAGDPTRIIYIFGFKRDVGRVEALSRLFMDDARVQAIKLSPPSNKPDDTIHWRASFLSGYAQEVARRYREAKALLDQENEGWHTTSKALVLVTRDEQVQADFTVYSKSVGLTASKGSRMTHSAHGYESGKEAARNSNIGRERIGGRGGALGSGS